MSQRHATTTTTTTKAAPKRAPKMLTPNLPPLPPIPTQKKPVVQKKRKERKKEKRELKWWEHAGPLIDTLSGKLFKDVIPMIFGFGDYEINSNSITASGSDGKIGGSVPIMSNSKHCNIIRHREYIGDVFSSTQEFSVTQYPINPGMDQTFPWLSPVALAFTNYRMRGLVFDFVSTASNVATTPALGYVAMATQYNSLDTAFSNKRALDNSEYACSSAPTKSFMHPIECDPSMLAMKELYVRHQTNPSGDIRLYDMGRFSIATGGQSTTGDVIGELWATYEIELYFPLLANQTNFLTNSLVMSGACVANQIMGNLNPAAINVASTFQLTSITNVSPTVSELVFPSDCAGQSYRMVWNAQGFGATTSAHPFTGSSPDPLALTVLSSTNGVASGSGIGPFTTQINSVVFKVLQGDAVLRLTSPGAFGTVGGLLVCTISQIPNGFVY